MHERQRWIAHWHSQNALTAQQVPEALRLAGIPPSPKEWHLWIDRLLLWIGVTASLAGLVFFVAANWSEMGRFFKFALAEAAIILSLVAYVMGARFRYSNAALLAASLAVGALLALIGQTYQTGANTFELFIVWALLITPWVLLAKLPALWVLWLVILHVAYVFYLDTFGLFFGFDLTEERSLVPIALFDFSALIVWECFAAKGWEWTRGRWVPRLLALVGGTAVTILAVLAILQHHDTNGLYYAMYGISLIGLYGTYRHAVFDLFMLAGTALSLIVVTTTGLGDALLAGSRDWTGSLFILAIFSMLATAAAARWLRNIARAQNEREKTAEEVSKKGEVP